MHVYGKPKLIQKKKASFGTPFYCAAANLPRAPSDVARMLSATCNQTDIRRGRSKTQRFSLRGRCRGGEEATRRNLTTKEGIQRTLGQFWVSG